MNEFLLTFQDQPLKDAKPLTILIILFGASMLSVGGSIIILFFYSKYQQFRNYQFLLVFFLALYDLIGFGMQLIESFFFLIVNMQEETRTTFCSATSQIKIYFLLTSFFWTSIIAYCMRASLTMAKTEEMLQKQKFKFFMIALGIALFIVLSVPLITIAANQKIEYDSKEVLYCFFHLKSEIGAMDVPRFFIFYFPLLIVIFYNSYQQYQVRKIWKNEEDALPIQLKNIGKWMMAFPLCLILCWGPFFIFRIINIFGKYSMIENIPLFVFAILAHLIGYSQGFWNFCVQGLLNKDVRELLLKAICCQRIVPSTQDSLLMVSEKENKEKEIEAAPSLD